jgi:hypothetical protein
VDFGVDAAAPMKIGLAIFAGTATALLWRGFALRTIPGTAATLATGAASGFFNGAIGIGGPPVILFYFGSPAAVNVGRASVIAYFLPTMGLAMAPHELIDSRPIRLQPICRHC